MLWVHQAASSPVNYVCINRLAATLTTLCHPHAPSEGILLEAWGLMARQVAHTSHQCWGNPAGREAEEGSSQESQGGESKEEHHCTEDQRLHCQADAEIKEAAEAFTNGKYNMMAFS